MGASDFKFRAVPSRAAIRSSEDPALERNLREALAHNRFELHYQPRVAVHTRRIEGAEALLRWRDPLLGIIPASCFLPSLQSIELIRELSQWVVERAARDAQHWRGLGLAPLRISVNISGIELSRPDFAPWFLRLTRPWASKGFEIDIEITENTLLGDTANLKKLHLLRSAGIQVAVDDFGSGQSSLGTIFDLPIDSLKIDRMFIEQLPTSAKHRTLVAAILSLAHGLNLTSVAEGVETLEQLEALRQLGCSQAQGYLHSPAVSRDELTELMRHGKGWLALPAEQAGDEANLSFFSSIRVNAI